MSEQDIDRYERLQRASEKQIENSWEAYKRFGYLMALAVTIIGGLGSFFLFSDLKDFKEQTRQDIREERDLATKRVEARIDEEFKKENIQRLIEGKVSTISDSFVRDNIRNEIDPRLAFLSNQLTSLEAGINEARKEAEELENVIEVQMTALSAQSDDRFAFDRLVKLRDRTTNQYRPVIVLTISAIIRKLERDDRISRNTGESLDWNGLKLDPDKASWQDHLELATSGRLAIDEQVHLLRHILDQSRFPKDQRYRLCYEVIRDSPSLALLSTACSAADKDAQLRFNVLGAPLYLKWLSSQLQYLTISNCTATLKTNSENAGAYKLRGDAYCVMGKYQEAAADFAHAVRLCPTNADCCNAYAWFLATCPTNEFRDGKKAFELAQNACELTKWKVWYCVGTLAAACAEKGDYEQAVTYVKQALEMGGLTDRERNAEKRRLSLYEQKQPIREVYEW